MASNVFSVDPAALTTGTFFDGTDAGTAMQPGMFASPDTDEALPSAEEGAAGIVGPVTGAQHVQNAAQPGSMSI